MYYDSNMIERLADQTGKSTKNWSGEEKRWMRNLQSTGSLRLPRELPKKQRAAGSGVVDFRASSDASGRIAGVRHKMGNRTSAKTAQKSEPSDFVVQSQRPSIVF